MSAARSGRVADAVRCLRRGGFGVVAALALLAASCSGSGQAEPEHPKAGAGGSGGSDAGAGGSVSSGGAGGSSASGGSGTGGTGGKPMSTGGTSGSSGSSGTGAQGDGGPMGGPGCGLDAAAFCETFDAPSKHRGRAGELDATLWSGSRMAPDGPTAHHSNGQAFGIYAAPLRPERVVDGATTRLPACRGDVADSVYPDDDALICDPSSDIDSNHLLVAVASQNYGQNSYRVRQPFDFAERTGKVVFDAEAQNGGLLGWISLDITEDPIGAPSFQSQENLEGGVLPRSGLSIQFKQGCTGMDNVTVTASDIHVFDDWVETITDNKNPPCVPTEWGKLNHFEVSVSKDLVEVRATPFSDDGGKTFGDPVLLISTPVSLPFTRGYVQITTHNHATRKYSAPDEGFGIGFTNLVAWVARWDNVGFDGPIISNFREYEVGDPLGTGMQPDGVSDMLEVRYTGFTVADQAMGPSTSLEFSGVDLTDVSKASIALDAWYCAPCVTTELLAKFTLRYRLNGNDWIDRPLNDKEVYDLTAGNGRGALGHMLDVPIADLVAGTNTLEILAVDVAQNYPPGVANVDLVLQTK